MNCTAIEAEKCTFHPLLCRPPMSLSGFTELATSTNAAYEMRKEGERQDISDYDYDLAVQDQPPSPQFQCEAKEYEVPSPFPAVPALPPPAVPPSRDREGGAQEEEMYETIPGN